MLHLKYTGEVDKPRAKSTELICQLQIIYMKEHCIQGAVSVNQPKRKWEYDLPAFRNLAHLGSHVLPSCMVGLCLIQPSPGGTSSSCREQDHRITRRKLCTYIYICVCVCATSGFTLSPLEPELRMALISSSYLVAQASFAKSS